MTPHRIRQWSSLMSSFFSITLVSIADKTYITTSTRSPTSRVASPPRILTAITAQSNALSPLVTIYTSLAWTSVSAHRYQIEHHETKNG